MDGSAGSVGRIMAPLLGVPERHHAGMGRLGHAFQLDELHPRRARGHRARPRLPAGRGPRALRGGGGRTCAARSASPELRALLALEVRRARAMFAEAEPAIAAAPGSVRSGMRLRRRRLPARARPRRADRLRRPRPRAPACARGSSRAPCSGRCAGDAPGDPARRRRASRSPATRARRRADLRRELRGARGRARAGRAAAPTCSSSTATRSASARRPPARRRRRGSRRWACATRSARSCRAWRSTRRTGRRGSGCRGAGRRSTTGRCAEELWAQCDARFEIAKVERRVGRSRSRPTAGPLTAPLIVDALGWRRVLGSGPNVQPPEALISRGLEVHPDARGGDTDLDVWIDRSLIRSGYAWSVPAGGEQRVGVGSYEPRDHVKEPTRDIAGPARRRRRSATRATGSRTRCARRPRTASSSPATAPGHCFPLSGEGIRTAFYFGIACGRELRRVLAGAATREEALAAYGAFSAAHAAGVRARAAAAAADPGAAAAGPDRAARASWGASARAGARSRGTWSRRTRASRRARPARAATRRVTRLERRHRTRGDSVAARSSPRRATAR